MNTLQDIEKAIRQLPFADVNHLERWFYTQFYPLRVDEERSEALGVEEPRVAYQVDPQRLYLSIDEYRRLEEQSEIKHEYVAGEIFAMSGASLGHNRVSGKLFNVFSNHLKGGPCEAFMADMRLHIETEYHDFCYYPDVMVACNLQERSETCEIETPKLVIEVLSPSTQSNDRREKALTYQRVSSIEEFALVAQDRPEVTIYRRHEKWRPQLISGMDAIVQFTSIQLSLPLKDIFDDSPE